MAVMPTLLAPPSAQVTTEPHRFKPMPLPSPIAHLACALLLAVFTAPLSAQVDYSGGRPWSD